MKKIISLVIALTLVFTLCATGFTAQAAYYGNIGANITATLVDSVLTISGSGNTYSYGSENGSKPWGSARLSVKEIIVEEGITGLGDSLFYDCENVEKITLPSTLNYVENRAFYDCRALNSVYITDMEAWYNIDFSYLANPLSYGADLYLNGELVTQVVIPENTERINDYVFTGCDSITSITIPDSVTEIGQDAFYNTGYYNNAENWEDGILYIDDCLIATNEWECPSNIVVKDGIRVIADWAFEYNNCISTVSLPDSLTHIGDYAFNSSYITNVQFGNGLKRLGEYAFSFSKIRQIVLPNSINKIENSTFFECINLESVTIPEGIKEIGSGAFENCTQLKAITIPASVEKIGGRAFAHCFEMNDITILGEPIGVSYENFEFAGYMENKENYENGLLYCGKVLIKAGWADSYGTPQIVPSGAIEIKDGTVGIGENAFRNCNEVTSVKIPDSIKYIDTAAFYNCSGITSIKIPDGIEKLGGSVFYGCTSLEDITIPEKAGYMFANAFYNTAYYNNTDNWQNGVLYLGKFLLDADDSVAVNYEVADGTRWILDGAFSMSNQTVSIMIPKSVEYVGKQLFSNWFSVLENVYYEGTEEEWEKIAPPPEPEGTGDLYYPAGKIYTANIMCNFSLVKSSDLKIKNILSYTKDGEKSIEVYVDKEHTDMLTSIQTVFTQGENVISVTEYTVVGDSLKFVFSTQNSQDVNVVFKGINGFGTECSTNQVVCKLSRYTGDGKYMQYVDTDVYDANDDGTTNVKDLIRLKKMLASLAQTNSVADLDCDGEINAADLVLLAKFIINAEKGILVYEVTFTDDDGNLLLTMLVPEGYGAKPTITPKKDGYNFVGWDSDCSNIKSDLIIKAVFEKSGNGLDETIPEDWELGD